MPDEMEKTVRMQPLNYAQNNHQKVYSRIDRIGDLSHSLRAVDKAHCHALAESFCNYTFDYARGPITVHFLAAVNPAGVTYATAVHRVDSKKSLKNDFHMFKFNPVHQRRSVELLRDEDHHAWAAKPLRIRYIFSIIGKPVTASQRIKLSIIANISPAIVHWNKFCRQHTACPQPCTSFWRKLRSVFCRRASFGPSQRYDDVESFIYKLSGQSCAFH